MRVAPEWATEDLARTRDARNNVEIPRYSKIERDFSSEVQRLVGDFLSGRTNEHTLVSSFRGRLFDAETDAFVAGRRARGDNSPTVSDSEAEMLAGRHSSQMRFFHSFVQDMKAGRGTMNYITRADQYAKSLWSIYTRGETTDWEDPEHDNARYFLILEPGANHCAKCIARAKLSRDKNGLTWDELSEVGWPGEKCECGPNCRCHVRVVRKTLVLPERFDNAAAAASGKQGLEQLQKLLGGEDLPLKLPATGLPYTSLSPEVVNQSLRIAGEDHDDLAKRLPLIPKVLTSPKHVVTDLEGKRFYVGDGITIGVSRNDEGIWSISHILYGDNWGKKAA